MPRYTTKLTIALLLIALIAFGSWHLSRPEPLLVTTKPVTQGAVEDTVVNTRAGAVKAFRRAKLSPGTGGQIARLDVKEGDRVKAGDLLLEFWNRDLMAEIVLNESEKQAGAAQYRKTR